MLQKLERKFGRYAIPNLMRYLIAAYVLGWVLSLVGGISGVSFISFMRLDPYAILHGQIWRIFTWIMIPQNSSILWFAIMLFLYYQLGNALERTWGTFRFNLYIFGGMFFTLLGAFILYIGMILSGTPGIFFSQVASAYFSMYYINLSIFLAFAVSYPDNIVMLYFIIPVKMKWMAVVYGAMILYSLFTMIRAGQWYGSVAIISSLLNFLLFFLSTRNYRRIDPREAKRKADFRRSYYGGATGGGIFGGFSQRPNQNQQSYNQQRPNQQSQPNNFNPSGVISRHKCAICGRTEISNPELEFRFCSKCSGLEYCNDHLYSHTHRL